MSETTPPSMDCSAPSPAPVKATKRKAAASPAASGRAAAKPAAAVPKKSRKQPASKSIANLQTAAAIAAGVPPCDSSSNLMELKTFRTQFIRDWIDSLRSTLTDITIIFTPDAMTISETNSSETVFVITKLNTTEFERYYSDPRVTVSVNVPLFSRTLSRIQDKTVVTLFVARAMPEVLNIRIDGEMTATYKFESLDRVPMEIDIPELTYPVKISINSQTFAKRLRDMDAVGVRFVRLQASADSFLCTSIRTSADEHHRAPLVQLEFRGVRLIGTAEGAKDNTALGCEEVVGPNRTEESPVRQVGDEAGSASDAGEPIVQTGAFPLKFIINFTKQSSLAQMVNIYIKNDMPLLVEYVLPNVLGYVRFFAMQASLM